MYVRKGADRSKNDQVAGPTPLDDEPYTHDTRTPSPGSPTETDDPILSQRDFYEKSYQKLTKFEKTPYWVDGYTTSPIKKFNQTPSTSQQQVSENPATLHSTKSTKHPSKIKPPTTPSSRIRSLKFKPKVLITRAYNLDIH